MDLSSDPASLSVLFVAPECAPLTKTGGLGDVCGALPAALRALGVDVRVLIPGYREVLGQTSGKELARISLLGFEVRILAARVHANSVPMLVIDCPELYKRSGGPYQDGHGDDWTDNGLRFGLLSKVAAMLGSAQSPLRWRPDILHCNDWPTALAPVFLAGQAQRSRAVMTIHNLAFQGNFDPQLMDRLGVAPEHFSIEGLEFYGRMSFLKGGIAYADAVTTVSPTYAGEIQTPQFGCGLDGLLRKRRDALLGILNGIDGAAWNPASDVLIAQRYDAATLERKSENKAALQRRMGLLADPDVALLGQVGRMTHQKGSDLLLAAAEELAAMGQIVVLGSGERGYERALRDLAERHPGRISVQVGFDEELAHLIEAGADLFLMPSRYEPCGLNQMYSQRYGTPPIVRATGGLADTVTDGVTGFVFEEAASTALVAAVRRGVAAYREPGRWKELQRAGMSRDFSWNAAARRYADLYLRLAMLERV
jgi:starch synthase